MMQPIRMFAVLGLLLVTGIFYTMAADQPTPEQRRKDAQQSFKAGNFRDAYDAARSLALEEAAQGETLADDLSLAAKSLQRLQRLSELDDLFADVLEMHPNDWQLLRRAGNLILQTEHYGYVVDGVFQRGNQRGGGRFQNVTERDRVQALIWLHQAVQQMPDDAPLEQKADIHAELGAALLSERSDGQAWRLQTLTDLTQLPEEYAADENGRIGRGHGGNAPGAPVDEEGQPLFYSVPKSFDAVINDGERWRWCLQQSVEFDASRKEKVQLEFADFLLGQFGVQTLRQWGVRLPAPEDEGAQDAGIWALSSLKENETIARLANGIRRFELPDEFNFLRIYQEVSQSSSASADTALQRLGQIFEDRQQYPQAAEIWRDLAKRFPTSRRNARDRLQQIVGNWGRFEPVMHQAAGSGAQVDFRFRNSPSVFLTAHQIKIPELLADIRRYLKSNPKELDYEKIQIETIGYRLVNKNERRYLGDEVAKWTLDLQPRENHFDRRITVTTPLQKAGAYLLVAKLPDGNTSRIVLWMNDTAIVEKPVHGQTLYYVADAVTGEPVPKAHVEFFGWSQDYDQLGKRSSVSVREFAESSNENGFVLPEPAPPKDLHSFQWLAVARTPGGRFAYLGFNGVWAQEFRDPQEAMVKGYGISDRPVYRPDQPVQFKFWVQEASYEKTGRSRFAGEEMTVKIFDPQGTEVTSQTLKADEFGGLTGEYRLPESAPLGQYTVSLSGKNNVSAAMTFRVEEYKKPEFEVTIKAPEKPVQLGDRIEATIEAKYYYGAPVTNATVSVRVERTAHDSNWFPHDPWDWLYGNGYWWFARDYDWYPGFDRWGCVRPGPVWGRRMRNPPELVVDQEVQIGADGTATIEIDTALAKALHGNEDHAYSITAEVTDASRRTIVGSGKVYAAREPYRIFVWTDRGHFQVGDSIEARFQARTLDGNGVAGSGTLRLLKVSYENGKPIETVAQEWPLTTNNDGAASQTFKASESGQYRLSFKMTAGEGAPEIEGGSLFVIRGDGFDGSKFQFNDLEVIVEKKSYAPGEKVKLAINTNRVGGTVLLFPRAANGVAARLPQVIRLTGKSSVVELDVAEKDMPNFFVEALTISNGRVHNVIQEIVVPPQGKVLNVEVVPSTDRYQPGANAQVDVKVTDEQGRPVEGSLVLSVYDRAVEYISGGSNVEDIKKFFWGWKRSHHPSQVTNLEGWSGELLKRAEVAMAMLGVFGEENADVVKAAPMQAVGRSMKGGMGGLGGGGFGSGARMEMMMDSAPAGFAFTNGLAPAYQGDGGGLATPTIRTNFADTAYWNAHLETDADGFAQVEFAMPENLSSWTVRAWGMGNGVRVGENSLNVVTAKDLVVRLQAPRFFTETDEVVLSAVVHNYLSTAKDVQVQLGLDGNTLELLEGGTPAVTMVSIPSGGEARVDWRVKATAPGVAHVTMQALTDEESDAMSMQFPVNVHGILKTESFSRVIAADQSSAKIELNVPEDRLPDQTRLEVRYSPTLAGAMVDALPYLAEYPYGCTEQTLNRFLPTVVTQNILRSMNLDLAAIQEKRTNLNSQELGDDRERARAWRRFDRNPVFDEAEVRRMVKRGVEDLTAMQNSDGGWGWFSGFGERSYPHTTAVVVQGLQLAEKNDVALVTGVLPNGVAWLKRWQSEQVALLLEGERTQDAAERKKPYRAQCTEIDALVFSVLAETDVHDEEMQRFLYRDRNHLSLYAQALLGLALHTLGATERRDMVLRNIDQFVAVDDENQTAYLNLPNDSSWWYWHGNQVEANACLLKLLTRVNVKDPKAAGIAKYLINNRKHGTYWNSTRDTAYCVEALAEFVKASGEARPNMQVEVWLDGELKQTVEITPETLFTFDNSFVLEGDALTSGAHTLELRRKPLDEGDDAVGPLYVNAYLTNFTKEEFITATGLEVKVTRSFSRLVQDKDATEDVAGSRGQAIGQSVLKYRREKLESLAEVRGGDLIEVELKIESKNDYEYVVFEDLKAAGLEATDLQSGYTAGGLGAYVEYRDEKVAFFLRQLRRGTHSVSYRLRAEIPGQFSALPAQAHAMYAPELRANSDEMKLRIEERE